MVSEWGFIRPKLTQAVTSRESNDVSEHVTESSSVYSNPLGRGGDDQQTSHVRWPTSSARSRTERQLLVSSGHARCKTAIAVVRLDFEVRASDWIVNFNLLRREWLRLAECQTEIGAATSCVICCTNGSRLCKTESPDPMAFVPFRCSDN